MRNLEPQTKPDGAAPVSTAGLARNVPALKVKVFPFREKVCMGNIIWADKYPMRGGKFPSGHPICGSVGKDFSQYGDGQNIVAFRGRGYWASCFPEGDGITWKPERGQSDEQCMVDIRESFGWDALWGHAL